MSEPQLIGVDIAVRGEDETVEHIYTFPEGFFRVKGPPMWIVNPPREHRPRKKNRRLLRLCRMYLKRAHAMGFKMKRITTDMP